MAISKFKQNPKSDLSALYNFLTANKKDTFLENVDITLADSEDSIKNGKIIFNNGNSELYISALGFNVSSTFINYRGKYVTNYMNNYSSGSYRRNIDYDSALLCSKGLIISANASSSELIPRLVITVDNAGNLALIIPNSNAYSYKSSDNGYCVSTYDSIEKITVNISPAYGMNKTSLAPVALMAESTDRYLPYAYAALTTQLDAEGLQSVLIDGAPYITNGIWYIKDGD